MFQLILENCTCYLSKKHIYVDVTAKSIHLNVSFSLWLVVKTVRKLVAPVNYEKVGLETNFHLHLPDKHFEQIQTRREISQWLLLVYSKLLFSTRLFWLADLREIFIDTRSCILSHTDVNASTLIGFLLISLMENLCKC